MLFYIYNLITSNSFVGTLTITLKNKDILYLIVKHHNHWSFLLIFYYFILQSLSGQAIRNTNMPRERTDIDYKVKEFWLCCTWSGENFRVCFLSCVQGHPGFQSLGVSTRSTQREAKFFQSIQHEEHFFPLNLLSRSCIIPLKSINCPLPGYSI